MVHDVMAVYVWEMRQSLAALMRSTKGQ